MRAFAAVRARRRGEGDRRDRGGRRRDRRPGGASPKALAHLGNPRGLSSSSRGFLPAPAMPTGATTRARWRRVGAAEVLRAVPRTATLDATITDMASLFVRSVSAAGARRECGGNHSRVDADKSPGSVTVCAYGRVRLERCNSSPIAPGPFVTKYLYVDMICSKEITFLSQIAYARLRFCFRNRGVVPAL